MGLYLTSRYAAVRSESARLGRSVEIRDVHAAAKQRFTKAQQELSIRELTRKRDWLERCLRARRLV